MTTSAAGADRLRVAVAGASGRMGRMLVEAALPFAALEVLFDGPAAAA